MPNNPFFFVSIVISVGGQFLSGYSATGFSRFHGKCAAVTKGLTGWLMDGLEEHREAITHVKYGSGIPTCGFLRGPSTYLDAPALLLYTITSGFFPSRYTVGVNG